MSRHQRVLHLLAATKEQHRRLAHTNDPFDIKIILMEHLELEIEELKEELKE